MTNFKFKCPHCLTNNCTDKTTSGKEIPEYDDTAKEFYVTCLVCFSIIIIRFSVFKAEMMNSNK